MKSNINCVSMNILALLEPEIKELLNDINIWNSFDIDYEPPRVERLYTEYKGYRIFLHTIHKTEEDCLFHKHKWPAAFKQIYGSYEMGITYSEDEISSNDTHDLPIISKFIINQGTYYEMTQTDCLHYVKPIDGISCSIMITKDLYPEAEIRKESLKTELKILSHLRKKIILDFYKKYL